MIEGDSERRASVEHFSDFFIFFDREKKEACIKKLNENTKVENYKNNYSFQTRSIKSIDKKCYEEGSQTGSFSIFGSIINSKTDYSSFLKSRFFVSKEIKSKKGSLVKLPSSVKLPCLVKQEAGVENNKIVGNLLRVETIYYRNTRHQSKRLSIFSQQQQYQS